MDHGSLIMSHNHDPWIMVLIKNDPWIFNDPLKKMLSQTIFAAAVGGIPSGVGATLGELPGERAGWLAAGLVQCNSGDDMG